MNKEAYERKREEFLAHRLGMPVEVFRAIARLESKRIWREKQEQMRGEEDQFKE